MSKKLIKVAHSPDADDFFMFWAIREKLIDTAEYQFSFESFDTQTLNELAETLTYDVIAISLASYPKVSEHYAILTHGASIGNNYGPILVAKEEYRLEDLHDKIIGIPGRGTTAAKILKKILPSAKTTEISITPYDRIFQQLDKDNVDAALLIHEGQIAYKKKGYTKILDIGVWWNEQTSLPLPLGINVIRTALGKHATAYVSKIIKDSINYALENKDSLLDQLLEQGKSRGVEIIDPQAISDYLSMYANHDSLMMNDQAKLAIEKLIGSECKVRFCD